MNILTIRCHTGISGDILLTGFAALYLARNNLSPDSEAARHALSELCASIMPELADCLEIIAREVNHVRGWSAKVTLPHAHEHRTLTIIEEIIDSARISAEGRENSKACFRLLADCEASVHGIGLEEVHFHEVGALDSILDICAVCELFQMLGAPELNCSPLPVCDGEITCMHGRLPAPAPAALRLLQNVPVRPFEGSLTAGELLTPTGVALLRALNANFGPWPQFRLQETALVYGSREFPGVANGAIFALGSRFADSALLPDQGNPLPLCQP